MTNCCLLLESTGNYWKPVFNLLEGEMTPEEMAELSKGRLRNKREELAESLVGRFRPHHALLLSRRDILARLSLGAQFGRFAARKGKQRAAIAVGHSILEAIYFIVRDDVVYQELGPEYFDKLNKDHIIRHYKKRLEALGLLVEVSEAPIAA